MRGRKPACFSRYTCASVYVEIYPREGTETYIFICQPSTIRLKFIPVRGRKRELLILKAVFAVLKFIPVRGRKLDDLVDGFTVRG